MVSPELPLMQGVRTITPPRELSLEKKVVLCRVLEVRVPEDDKVRAQASSVLVCGECKCGCRSILLSVRAGDSARLAVARGVTAEAEAEDKDGTPIWILVHVLDGVLRELEIVRADSQRLEELPRPESMILPPDSGSPN